jgi:hypothetical protein
MDWRCPCLLLNATRALIIFKLYEEQNVTASTSDAEHPERQGVEHVGKADLFKNCTPTVMCKSRGQSSIAH